MRKTHPIKAYVGCYWYIVLFGIVSLLGIITMTDLTVLEGDG